MKRVWEVLVPHDEVLQGKLTENSFVGNLGSVWEKRKLGKDVNVEERYYNPRMFIERTYLTSKMREVVTEIFRRLNGADGRPVYHLRVGLGGGKTHTLLLLYHLTENWNEIGPIFASKFGLNVGLPPKVRTVVVDGTKLEIFGYPFPDGTKVKTIWGMILKQLDKYDERYDSWDYVPSTTVLKEAFNEAPTLILIDELTLYIERLDEEKQEKVKAFLQNLTTAVEETYTTALLIATPEGEFEKAFRKIKNILERYSSIKIVTSPDESKQIRRIALFKGNHFLETAKEVAQAYKDAYIRNKMMLSTDIAEIIVKSYPFHPAVDMLLERLKGSKEFQLVRDELRFLASLVYSVYKNNPKDAYLITPAHIDITDDYVLAGTIAKIGDLPLATRLKGDWNRLDSINDTEIRDLAKKVLGFIVLNSLVETVPGESGTGRNAIYFALTSPTISKNLLDSAINEVLKRTWFVSVDPHTGRFLYGKPNINKIISDYTETIKNKNPEIWKDVIKETLDKWLDSRYKEYNRQSRERIFQKSKIIMWASSSDMIPDSPDYALKLAFVSWDRSASSKAEAVSQVREFFEYYGSRPREYKNTVVFLVPDAETTERAKDVAYRLKAIELIEEEKEKNPDLKTKTIEKSLELEKHRNITHLSQLAILSYRYLVYPYEELKAEELETTGLLHQNILLKVEEKLLNLGKVINNVSPAALVERYWPQNKKKLEVRELKEYFYKVPSFEYISRPEKIENAITEAVKAGLLAYIDESGRAHTKTSVFRLSDRGVLTKDVKMVKLTITVKGKEGKMVSDIAVYVDGERIRLGEPLEDLPGSKHVVKIDLPADYEFLGWSDGTKDLVKEITLEKDIHLEALVKKREQKPKIKIVVKTRDIDGNPINAPIIVESEEIGEESGFGQLAVSISEGSSLRIRVHSTEEYRFISWQGGGGDEEITIRPRSNLELVALFKKVGRSPGGSGLGRERWILLRESGTLEKVIGTIRSNLEKEVKYIKMSMKLPLKDFIENITILTSLVKEGKCTVSLQSRMDYLGFEKLLIEAEGDLSKITNLRQLLTQAGFFFKDVTLRIERELETPETMAEVIDVDVLEILPASSEMTVEMEVKT
ncbi:DUF499 domain-containing protein [Thermococcus sp.]|uniref:DUF499 domain-containing protein n=1 Tax=Thermococcus sp. TaxID=35749 RepID=UPI00263438C8|nr:DUF499 domain-containing protein [Thermococcus sp.]